MANERDASNICIMISAGELSGDEHGAVLLQHLQEQFIGAAFFGMGGRNLRSQGLEIVVDAERSGSVMGVSEIFGGFGKIVRAWRAMKNLIIERQPDLLIIINYSEFNLRLARVAKREGVKVLFYIPPQVWAWRPQRVREINEVCDIVASIFPFEKQFYQDRGCDKVVYLGHPFVTQFEKQKLSHQAKLAFRQQLGFGDRDKVVLLFPGSRRKEIHAHFDFILSSFEVLQQQMTSCCGLLVAARAEWVEEFRARIPQHLNILVTSGDSQKFLQIGDVGLIKSGTSNLQALFSNLPFVMYYRPARVTAFFIRRFVKGIKQFSIVNILKENTVPEVVGEVLDPHIAAKHMQALIDGSKNRDMMLSKFNDIAVSLAGADRRDDFVGVPSASQRVVKLVVQLINH